MWCAKDETSEPGMRLSLKHTKEQTRMCVRSHHAVRQLRDGEFRKPQGVSQVTLGVEAVGDERAQHGTDRHGCGLVHRHRVPACSGHTRLGSGR